MRQVLDISIGQLLFITAGFIYMANVGVEFNKIHKTLLFKNTNAIDWLWTVFFFIKKMNKDNSFSSLEYATPNIPMCRRKQNRKVANAVFLKLCSIQYVSGD